MNELGHDLFELRQPDVKAVGVEVGGDNDEVRSLVAQPELGHQCTLERDHFLSRDTAHNTTRNTTHHPVQVMSERHEQLLALIFLVTYCNTALLEEDGLGGDDGVLAQDQQSCMGDGGWDVEQLSTQAKRWVEWDSTAS